MSTVADRIEKKAIVFENGGQAEILHARQSLEAEEILKALDIPAAQAAIIVGGSATPFPARLHNRLIDLLSRGVAQAALDCQAMLLDQGTKAGVSAIIGQGVADRSSQLRRAGQGSRGTKLVGVLARGTAGGPEQPTTGDSEQLDANHTHFVVNEQGQPAWQAGMLCRLAEASVENKDWILTILVGGETEGATLELALETVRRGWPLLVLEGSGPLADEIIRLKQDALKAEGRRANRWRRINPFSAAHRLVRLQETNPRLFEIINDGKILVIGANFDAIQLRNLIKGIFTHPPKENILWTAWQRFAEYDLNSGRHRAQWRWLKNLPLILGVISTLIVLIYSAPDTTLLTEDGQNLLWSGGYTTFMSWLSGIRGNSLLDLLFRFTIILLPITTSILLGVETRLKLGSKYILLRGAAEAVKRGIYSFRVLGQRGADGSELLLPHDEKGLADHLTRISKLLLESDVNEAAFAPYEGRIPPNMFGAEAYDDGFSPLDPDTYVKIRIGDQLKFYTLRTNQYEKRIRRLQIWILVMGGIGTFLAAVGAQYWLPFTAAIVSGATAYLEYQQLEQILTKYNLTKSSLENARSNWLALPEAERAKNVPKLVRDVEAILESENQGWVQYVNQVQESGKPEEIVTEG